MNDLTKLDNNSLLDYYSMLKRKESELSRSIALARREIKRRQREESKMQKLIAVLEEQIK